MSAAAMVSYVPRLLSHRLAAGEPLAGPEARRLTAAVLLTDIESFTSLVEAAGASRRQGLEELASALNAYFTDLVEIVYGHGGDVLSIAGDAFFCYWPAAGSEHLADATLRATQAAREIQRRLHGRPAGGDRRFGTRAGVGAGELTLAFVGGLDARWEIIASGRATAEVAAAEPLAAAGEVVLSPGAWSLLAARCSGLRRDAGCVAVAAVQQGLTPEPSPPRPAIADPEIRLRPYLPPAVLARILAPGIDWLAELRRVTVLLADMPDLGDASPQELERTHQSVRAIQEIVKRYEGTVRMDIDSKGVTALAVFGLPPLAHENDAQRALEAAHALEERWRTLGVPSRIGVATGRAFCGAFGCDLRREYMVRGDVINLAARLMRTQTSAIVCDHDTSHAASGRIVFEPLGQVALKGRAAAVEVYRPVGRREDRPVVADPLIGRTRERALLAGRLQALHERGESSVLIVEGEPGLGKSRLIAELGQVARAARVRVLTAAADAIESSTAYFAWRPVFTTLFGLSPADDPLAARRRINERMADLPDLARLVPLLGSVLPVQIPDNDLTAEMTGDVRAENTRLLLARILAAAAQAEATLLIIEDAHWLDSSSWALLLEVVRSVQPLLAVVAARPPVGGVPREREQLTRMPGTQVLRLEGLSPDETLALMRRCLGVTEVPDALARIIQERVAGHPFFCQELIQTLLEAGSVRVEGGACVVGDLSEASLPTTVEGVILSRLDRLTPGQQLCLKVGAVVGRVFRARTVRETHPIEPERERVAEHLDALARLELTIREGAGPDPTFAFKHVITRDVTYELMTLAQRQPLHRSVAEWYELNHAADLTPHYALLAHHWSGAGDPAKTVDYLERAGEQALRDGAFEEALRFYTQAMEIQDAGGVPQQGDRRAIWEKGVGTAHYFLGDLQQSRGRLERAVELLDRRVPARSVAVGRSLLGELALQIGHWTLPRRFLGRHASRKYQLDEAADCYRELGQIYYLDGEPGPRLLYITLRGLNVGEEAGPSPTLARLLINFAGVLSLLGKEAWADWYGERAIQMAAQEGQYAAAAYVWHINALKQAQRGQWSAARAANDRALKLIKELGDFNLEAEAWVVRSTVQLCEGDFAAAPAAWSRARELAERTGNDQIRCWSLLDEVDTLHGRGWTEEAARVLADALAVPTAPTDGSSTIDKQRALAVTRLRQRRFDEAVGAADVVIDMIARTPPTGYHWVDFCASAVEVYLDVLIDGDSYASTHRAQLADKARRGCKLVRRLARVFGNIRPRSWLLQGMLLWQQGETERALRAWSTAKDTARRMDMPFEEARALLELARHARTAATEAELARAEEIFSRLGATRYLEIASATRATSGAVPP